MADQLMARVLPAYGNRVAKSPHIDALAAAVVVFESFYCNSPLCAPSRFSFLCGRQVSAIGAYDNAAELAAQVPTFAHFMRRAGYQTVLSGKMHFCGADQLHGFEERLTTDIYPADFGWTPDWNRFEQRPSWCHTMDSVTQAGPCPSMSHPHDPYVIPHRYWGSLCRHFVYDALRAGRHTPWDFQPGRDASRLYVRNDQELGDMEGTARFAPFGA